jgi:hypothetical protein
VIRVHFFAILCQKNVILAPDQYKELANRIEGLLSGQTSLFRSTLDIEKLACEAVEKITKKQAAEQPVANHGHPTIGLQVIKNLSRRVAWLTSRVRSMSHYQPEKSSLSGTGSGGTGIWCKNPERL